MCPLAVSESTDRGNSNGVTAHRRWPAFAVALADPVRRAALSLRRTHSQHEKWAENGQRM
jgi:hypothetical protein